MSTKKILSYAPSLVKVSLFGINIDGFSPDGVVDIEREEGATRFKKAQDGSRTAIVDRYGSYRVTVHLLQTSPSNTWLHVLYKLYQKTGVEFKIPINVEDTNGESGTSFSATDVFFEDEPSTNFTDGAEVSSWTFICHDGNYQKKGAIQSYDVAEKLGYLFSALSIAESFGVGLDDVVDVTSSMLDTLNDSIFNKF